MSMCSWLFPILLDMLFFMETSPEHSCSSMGFLAIGTTRFYEPILSKIKHIGGKSEWSRILTGGRAEGIPTEEYKRVEMLIIFQGSFYAGCSSFITTVLYFIYIIKMYDCYHWVTAVLLAIYVALPVIYLLLLLGSVHGRILKKTALSLYTNKYFYWA